MCVFVLDTFIGRCYLLLLLKFYAQICKQRERRRRPLSFSHSFPVNPLSYQRSHITWQNGRNTMIHAFDSSTVRNKNYICIQAVRRTLNKRAHNYSDMIRMEASGNCTRSGSVCRCNWNRIYRLPVAQPLQMHASLQPICQRSKRRRYD